MKRREFLRKSSLTAAGIVVSPLIAQSAGNSIFKDSGKIQVVELEGSAKNRGRVHGELLKDKIAESIKRWKDNIRNQRREDPNKYINDFMDNTNFEYAVKKWTPDLLDEVKGIAEGSGIDYKTIFASQCIDEDWWYSRNSREGISLPLDKNCSALGVYGQKGIPPLVAQNLDIMNYTEGLEVLLHIKYPESSLETYVFTLAGFIAANGMSNRSVGVCVNTLLQLDQSPIGLPVAFVVRGIIEQQNYDNAVKFVKKIKHASGQNYTIGGPEEISAYECSANKKVRHIPVKGVPRLYHTNHPFVNDDKSIFEEIQKKYPNSRSGSGNSEVRYNTLKKYLKDPNEKITVEKIKSILSSQDVPYNPICNDYREGGYGFTAGCMVMELSGKPVFHLAPGPPNSTNFKKYSFD